MSRMSDEDIGNLIREIPRAGASADFTGRALQRLEEIESHRHRRPRWSAGALAAAALFLAFVSQGYLRRRLEQSKTAERVQALRDEYRELQVELEKLRALAREVEPILELGGTEKVDFVFDLRELAREENDRPQTEPVSLSPSRGEMKERKP